MPKTIVKHSYTVFRVVKTALCLVSRAFPLEVLEIGRGGKKEKPWEQD